MNQLSLPSYASVRSAAVRVGAILTALVVALGVFASPTQAAQVAVKDKAKDAPANIDILRAKYTNAGNFVAWRWEIRDIDNDAFLYGTTLQTCDGACSDYYQLQVTHKSGDLELKLREGGSQVIACKGMTGTWANKTGVVTARVPKKCIVGPAGLYMQVYATVGAASPDAENDRAPVRFVARG